VEISIVALDLAKHVVQMHGDVLNAMMRRLKSVPTAERTTEPAGARSAAERSCVRSRD
jgi:hypothetical protein